MQQFSHLSILAQNTKSCLLCHMMVKLRSPRPVTWEVRELSAPGATRFSVPGATSSASASPLTPAQINNKQIIYVLFYHDYLAITFYDAHSVSKQDWLCPLFVLNCGGRTFTTTTEPFKSWLKTDRTGEPSFLPCIRVASTLCVYTRRLVHKLKPSCLHCNE